MDPMLTSVIVIIVVVVLNYIYIKLFHSLVIKRRNKFKIKKMYDRIHSYDTQSKKDSEYKSTTTTTRKSK